MLRRRRRTKTEVVVEPEVVTPAVEAPAIAEVVAKVAEIGTPVQETPFGISGQLEELLQDHLERCSIPGFEPVATVAYSLITVVLYPMYAEVWNPQLQMIFRGHMFRPGPDDCFWTMEAQQPLECRDPAAKKRVASRLVRLQRRFSLFTWTVTDDGHLTGRRTSSLSSNECFCRQVEALIRTELRFLARFRDHLAMPKDVILR